MRSHLRFPAVLLLLVAACSSGGDGGSDPGPTPAIAIAINPTSATVQQGGNTAVAATLTRSGGFTGTVNFAVQGAPAGVTGAVSNVQTTGGTTTATVTINVGAAVAAGTYNLTLRATGSGVSDATATFALTVTAAPQPGSFTMAVTPTTVPVTRGASGTAQVTLTRTNFTGTVNLTVTGAPSGVTTSFDPAGATGTSSTLTLNVGAAAPLGNHTLTVRANATGQTERTATLTLTVNPASGGSGNVRLDFAQCAAGQKPIWFAAQDGDGPWTRVTGTADVYEFDIDAQRGAFAYVAQTGNLTQLFVVQYSRTELTQGINFCPPPPTGTATGTVAGLAAGDAASIWLGGGAASATAASANFTIMARNLGTFDLIAWRSPLPFGSGSPHRGIIRRDQNIPNGGSVGTLDFNGTEAFTPATATITVQGLGANDLLVHGMTYYTGAQCTFASLYQAQAATGNTFQAFGVPANQQRPTDFHQIAITAINGSTSTRATLEWFNALNARTVALPPELPATTPTNLTGPYRRLQASLTLATEFNGGATLSYTDVGTSRNVNIFASPGWNGSQDYVLATPDLSGADGWNNAWAPPTSGSLNWFIQAAGATLTSTGVCNEGARSFSSTRTGVS